MVAELCVWGGVQESVLFSVLWAPRYDENKTPQKTSHPAPHASHSYFSGDLAPRKGPTLDQDSGVLFILPSPTIFAFLKIAVLSESLSVQACFGLLWKVR